MFSPRQNNDSIQLGVKAANQPHGVSHAFESTSKEGPTVLAWWLVQTTKGFWAAVPQRICGRVWPESRGPLWHLLALHAQGKCNNPIQAELQMAQILQKPSCSRSTRQSALTHWYALLYTKWIQHGERKPVLNSSYRNEDWNCHQDTSLFSKQISIIYSLSIYLLPSLLIYYHVIWDIQNLYQYLSILILYY